MLETKIIKHLDVVDVEEIFPHEKTIKHNYLNLLEKTRTIGMFIDPLVIDKKTGLLLDGHHRFKVMKELGCTHAIVQKVNYLKEYIKIGTWFPFVRENKKILKEFLFEEIDFDYGTELIDKFKIPFLYVLEQGGIKKSYIFKDMNTSNLYDNFKMQDKLTKKLQEKKIHLKYCADTTYMEYIKKNHGILLRRVPKKEEIIDLALSKKVLPPKSTRHEIRNRLIRINMPYGWVISLPPKEARKRIISKLNRKIENRLVRTYTESAIVFY